MTRGRLQQRGGGTTQGPNGVRRNDSMAVEGVLRME
jgi:hypothetical protein